MMHRMMTLAALGLLTLSACEKKEAPAPAPETTAATPPAASAVPAAAAPAPEPVVDVASLPVEEQYEADADKEITAANLSTKLDELEKEIAAP
jgi:predicted outer membrane protein